MHPRSFATLRMTIKLYVKNSEIKSVVIRYIIVICVP